MVVREESRRGPRTFETTRATKTLRSQPQEPSLKSPNIKEIDHKMTRQPTRPNRPQRGVLRLARLWTAVARRFLREESSGRTTRFQEARPGALPTLWRRRVAARLVIARFFAARTDSCQHGTDSGQYQFLLVPIRQRTAYQVLTDG